MAKNIVTRVPDGQGGWVDLYPITKAGNVIDSTGKSVQEYVIDLSTHKDNNEIHVTQSNKNEWDAKETTSGAKAKAYTAETNAKAYADNKIGLLSDELSDNIQNINQQLTDKASIILEESIVYLNAFQIISPETDDTGRISRAIDYVIQNNKTTLEFNGTYNISGKIKKTNLKKLNVIGNNSKININIPDGTVDDFAILLKGDMTSSFSMKDLFLENTIASTKLDSQKSHLMNLAITNFDTIEIDNIASLKSHFGGIFIGNCNQGHIINSRSVHSRDRGIQVCGCNNFLVEGNYVSNCGIGFTKNNEIGYGITGSRLNSVDYGNNYNLTIRGNIVENISRTGIDFHNGNNLIIEGNTLHNCEYSGIYAVNENADKRVNNVKILNNHIYCDYVKYTKGDGAGILVGSIESGFNFGFAVVEGNILIEAHNLNNIAINHAGNFSYLSIKNNSIETSDNYNFTRGIIIVSSPVKIKNTVISDNAIQMNVQGTGILINDLERVVLKGNIVHTEGNVAVTYCLDAKNITTLLENGNLYSLPKLANHKTLYTNVTNYVP